VDPALSTLAVFACVSTDADSLECQAHSADAADTERPSAAASTRNVFIVELHAAWISQHSRKRLCRQITLCCPSGTRRKPDGGVTRRRSVFTYPRTARAPPIRMQAPTKPATR